MAKKYDSLAHTKYYTRYHIVFTPKYRRKIIYNQLRKDISEYFKKLCAYKGVEIIEGHMMPDHVHILVSIPPKQPLSGAVFKLLLGSEIVPVSASGTGVTVTAKVNGETVTINDNTFTIPEGGIVIHNLPASDNTYSIVEVSAPTGYVITNNTPATFKVEAGAVENVMTTEDVEYTSETNDFIISNTPGAELPHTGGIGTGIYRINGILMMLGAGYLLSKRTHLH